MKRTHGNERGQTMVEFAIIGTVLMMLTAGLVDSGRAFFQYNAVAAAARYGARWGSVVGGTCDHRDQSVQSTSSHDWCNTLGTGSGPTDNPFWTLPGNKPVWSSSTNGCLTAQNCTCPTSYSAANDSNSYLASNYSGSSSSTIVGAVVQRFDSSSSSTNFIVGNLTPGLDLSKTRVCIQLSSTSWNSNLDEWTPLPGDIISVYVYYPFFPVSALLPATQLNLVASAQYQIEGS